ncbi:hypothetical protein GCM10009552_29030 [Rothia nasimurium]|uniref:Uncharacterized protein n=1 Tax=Luteibacter anthropi TaxID=564369 RepID=A0A7X5ZIL6_9GAMM|nr:hypothetical protein [Luteibacter anthropi]NII06904.1 hypothetical protein [Luteibacter anthropi]
MTSVVVWKNQETNQVWSAADSRYSRDRPLTEQAGKLLPLRVSAHRPIKDGDKVHWDGVLELKLGFAYAGAIVPALVTHTMLTRLLAAVGSPHLRLPSLQRVADLAADVATSVIYDVAQGYGRRYDLAVFECALFGSDIGDARSLPDYGTDVGAFHCYPHDRHDSWPLVSPRRVELDQGEFLVMGTSPLEVADVVLARDPSRAFADFEPADAIGELIRTGRFEDVGGYVQLFNPIEGASIRQGQSGRPNVFGYDITRAEEILGLELALLR